VGAGLSINESEALEQARSLIASTVTDAGLDLVLVEQITVSGQALLRVYIEYVDPARQVTVADCARVNRLLNDTTELDELFSTVYNLEVSSPGVNRPLVRARDYERFLGEKAQIRVKEPIEGRRRFTGRLQSVVDGVVTLQISPKCQAQIPLGIIEKAKLKPDTADIFRLANETNKR